MADEENKPKTDAPKTDAPEASKPANTMSRQRQHLVNRSQSLSTETFKLAEQLKTVDLKDEIPKLNAQIKEEESKVKALTKQYEDSKKSIRELKAEKHRLDKERREVEEEIATLHEKEADIRAKKASGTLTKSEMSDAKVALKQIRADVAHKQLQEAGIRLTRTDVDQQLGDARQTRDENRALRVDASEKLRETTVAKKTVESQVAKYETAEERQLKSERAVSDYDATRQQKDRVAAEKTGPREMLQSARKAYIGNPAEEAKKAAASLGGGVTGAQRKEYEQATKEYLQLIEALKSARSALAGMQEGTEEYTKTQQDAAETQERAKKAAADIVRQEKGIQAQGLNIQGTAGRVGAGAQAFGSILSGMGSGAVDRFVTAEQRKQSELSIKSDEVQAYRNRATDASSFLATGGGSLFGAETPYAKGGGLNDSIKRLGEDRSKTMEGVQQYEGVSKLVGQLADAAMTVGQKTAEGAAAGSATLVGMAPGSVAGGAAGMFEAGKNLRGAGVDFLSNPAMMSMTGGDKVAGVAADVIHGVAKDVGSVVGKPIGAGISALGGKGEDFTEGAAQVSSGAAGILAAAPRVMQRGTQNYQESLKIVDLQTQQEQAGRVRERLNMAFAPQMQSYLDTLPMQKEIGRGRGASSAKERRDLEMNMEGLALDSDFAERGVAPDQVLATAATASRSLGRRGRGGNLEKTVRQSIEMESVGLGSASDNTQAISKMMRAGDVKDPNALMKQTMTEAFKAGLSDSQDFQGLLEAASQTAKSTVDYQGTLEGMLKIAGTGRTDDVKIAASTRQALDQEMGGQSGTWKDMVKFEQGSRGTAQLEKLAKESGIEFGQEDKTNLLGNLSRVDASKLRNKEYMDSISTKSVRDAAAKYEEKYGRSFYEDQARESDIQGLMLGGIEGTQSKEMSGVRDELVRAPRDANAKASLMKRFGVGGSAEEQEAGKNRLEDMLAKMGSALTAQGAPAEQVIGKQAGVLKELESTLGTKFDIKNKSYRKLDPKDQASYQEAVNSAGTPTTLAEKQAATAAGIKQADYEQSAVATTDFASGTKKGFGTGSEGKQSQMLQNQDLATKTINAATTMVPKDATINPLGDEVKKIVDGIGKALASMGSIKADKISISGVTGAVEIMAKELTGAVLDSGVSKVAQQVGQSIVSAIAGGISYADGAKSPPSVNNNTTKPSVPSPVQ
jgi:hypothetical protein